MPNRVMPNGVSHANTLRLAIVSRHCRHCLPGVLFRYIIHPRGIGCKFLSALVPLRQKNFIRHGRIFLSFGKAVVLMMTSIETYVRQSRLHLRKLVVNPRLRSAAKVAAWFGSGFLLSGASLAHHPQPLAMGLVMSLSGWRAACCALGGALPGNRYWPDRSRVQPARRWPARCTRSTTAQSGVASTSVQYD